MPVRAFFRDLHDRLSGCPPPVPTKQSTLDGPQGYKSKPTTTTTVSGFYSPTYQRRTKSRDNLRTKSPSSTSRLSPPSDTTSSSMASRTSRSPKPRRKLRLQVPLYIYPTSTSWEPLFTALSQHPTVQFDIIINPANGPGGDTPDDNYVLQVTRLNTYPNATLFGYVHVKWAERSLEDVFEDVRRYERWNKQSVPPSPTIPPTSASAMKVSSPLRPMDSGVTLAGAQRRRDLDQGAVDIHMAGIFVDEAPHHERHLGYMSSLHAYIRRSLSRGCLVWTNPGCPVAERYYEFADKVTCFEDGYGAWVDRGLEGFEGGRETRRKSTVMVHSCPRGRGEEMEVVRRAKEEGVEGVFVTVERGYEGWGVGWAEVVKAVEEA